MRQLTDFRALAAILASIVFLGLLISGLNWKNRFLSRLQFKKGQQLASLDWEAGDPKKYISLESNHESDFFQFKETLLWRARDNKGYLIVKSSNRSFVEGYNAKINQLTRSNKLPDVFSELAISNKEILSESSSPVVGDGLKSGDFGNISVFQSDDGGFLIKVESPNAGVKGVQVGVGETQKRFYSGLFGSKPEIRFIKIGDWMGVFHEKGYMIAECVKRDRNGDGKESLGDELGGTGQSTVK